MSKIAYNSIVMTEKKRNDSHELDLPDTLFSRDIENRVLQDIVKTCLLEITGISLLRGTLLDILFGRTCGIEVEQDLNNNSLSVKIELKIDYGISIPEKSEEIQSKVFQELTRMTGLHVAEVHVIFKRLSDL